MLLELPEHCPGSRLLPAGSVTMMTKNSEEEHGGRRSPEADVERVHVAYGTIPAGEIPAEPLTLSRGRRSLKCSDPGAQASGQLSTARDPTRPLQERPCQREAGTGQGEEGQGLLGRSDALISQFVPAFHRSAGCRDTDRARELFRLWMLQRPLRTGTQRWSGRETALRADPASKSTHGLGSLVQLPKAAGP